jgi:hypothetical protein
LPTSCPQTAQKLPTRCPQAAAHKLSTSSTPVAPGLGEAKNAENIILFKQLYEKLEILVFNRTRVPNIYQGP